MNITILMNKLYKLRLRPPQGAGQNIFKLERKIHYVKQ